MYTDLQIDFIRAFGDKELKEGCIVMCDDWIQRTMVDDADLMLWNNWCPQCNYKWRMDENKDIAITKILWHEPHLFPDVAKVLKEKNMHIEIQRYRYAKTWYTLNISKTDTLLLSIDFDPCLPLLEQPKVMEQLLSLIK